MRKRIASLAAAEWLMVLPAGLLIAVAILRQLQPRQLAFIPTIHVSHAGAAILFLGLPALACAIGAAVLLRLWRSNAPLRDDVKTALAIVWRNIAVGLLACAFLAAAAILAMSVVHIISD